MLKRVLAIANPQIAASKLKSDLDAYVASGRLEKAGGKLRPIEGDPMHFILELPGFRPDGQQDPYYLKLGATYYDLGPPTVEFVEPDSYATARNGSPHYPVFSGPPNFALHDAYLFEDGTSGQLVCFSFSAMYYMSNHSPTQGERWNQGEHNVAATINTLIKILRDHYQGPSKC